MLGKHGAKQRHDQDRPGLMEPQDGVSSVDTEGVAALRGMTDDQLKRLSRVELLEIMVAQARELEATQERLRTAQRQLRANQIALEQVAAVAHASLGRGEDPRYTQRALDDYEHRVAESLGEE